MWLLSVKKFRRKWDPKACELLHNMRCEKGGDHVDKLHNFHLSQIVVQDVINSR
jgi:hypothetical protein